MQKVRFDVEGALNAGYSKSEIAQELAKQARIDYNQAKSVYSDDEMITSLADKFDATEQLDRYNIKPQQPTANDLSNIDRNLSEVDERSSNPTDHMKLANVKSAMAQGDTQGVTDGIKDLLNAVDPAVRDAANKQIDAYINKQMGGEPAGESGIVTKGIQGIATGATQMAEGVSTMGEMLSKAVGLMIPGGKVEQAADYTAGMAKKAANYFGEIGQSFKPPEITPLTADNWKAQLSDLSYWSYQMGTFAPMMIGAIGAAMKTKSLITGLDILASEDPLVVSKLGAKLANIGATITGAIVPASMGATSTYRDVQNKGGTDKQALTAAAYTGFADTAMNAISLNYMLNRMGVNRLSHAAISGLFNASVAEAQSAAQPVSEYAAGVYDKQKDIKLSNLVLEGLKSGIDSVGPMFVLGFMGGAFAGYENKLKVDIATEDLNKATDPANPDKKAELKAVQTISQVGKEIHDEMATEQHPVEQENLTTERKPGTIEPSSVLPKISPEEPAPTGTSGVAEKPPEVIVPEERATFEPIEKPAPQEATNAEAVRSDQGQPGQERVIPEGSQNQGGENLQRQAPEQPGNAVQRQAQGEAQKEVDVIPTKTLVLEPDRFQYKREGKEAKGQGLKGKKFNPDLLGVLDVWSDPKDGRPRVVNGFNRANALFENNIPDAPVRYIKADTAEEARAIGALRNIGEGSGTAIDAAVFIKQSGMDRDQLSKMLPDKQLVKDGINLSRLPLSIINEISRGEFDEKLGATIGKNFTDIKDMVDAHDAIKQRLEAGRPVNQKWVDEYVRQMKSVPVMEMQDQQVGMFGDEPIKKRLIEERTSVSNHVLNQLSKDKALGAIAAKSDYIKQVGAGEINKDVASKLADTARIMAELYKKESIYKGPVSDALNEAAQKIAKGGNENAANNEAYAKIREHLQGIIEGTAKQSDTGVSEVKPTGPQQETLTGPGPEPKPEETMVGGESGSAVPFMEYRAAMWIYDKVAPAAINLAHNLTKWFDPSSMSEGALKTAVTFIEKVAAKEQRNAAFREELKADLNKWAGRSKDAQLHFIYSLERGKPTDKLKQMFPGEDLQKEIDKHREIYDKIYQASIKAGIPLNYLYNYFPHLCEDINGKPVDYSEIQNTIDRLSNDPSTRSRMINEPWAVLEEKLKEKGYKLKAYNPVEMLMLRHANFEQAATQLNIARTMVNYKEAALVRRPLSQRAIDATLDTVRSTVANNMNLGENPELARNRFSAEGLENWQNRFKKAVDSAVRERFAAGESIDYFAPENTISAELADSKSPSDSLLRFQKVKEEGLSRGIPAEVMDKLEQQYRDLSQWEHSNFGLQGKILKYFDAPDKHRYVTDKDNYRILDRAIFQPSLWKDAGYLGSGFRGMMHVKNAMVGAKLALSLFHFTHIGTMDVAQNFATAAKGMMVGRYNFAQAAKAFGEGLREEAAVASTVLTGKEKSGFKSKGKAACDAMLKSEKDRTPEENWIVQTATEGGVIFKMDRSNETFTRESINKWADENRLGVQFPSGASTIYHAFNWVNENFVPYMKAHAFIESAHNLQAEMGDKWSDPMARKKALQKIGRDIENRYGQMRYKNLLWNKMFKEAGILSSLSMGWKLGFLRQARNTTVDTFRYVVDTYHTPQQWTHLPESVIFSGAYVASGALLAAIMLGLITGKPPEELKDLVYPKTGHINPDGSEGRFNTPYYTREFYMMANHIQKDGLLGGISKYFLNSANPAMATMYRAWDNKDYYGNEIRGEFDPFYQQIEDTLTYLFKDSLPISWNAAEQSKKNGDNDMMLAFFGFGPAPAYIIRAKSQNDIFNLFQKRGLAGVTQKEDQPKIQFTKELKLAYLDANTKQKQQKFIRKFEEGQQKGYIKQSPSQFQSHANKPADVGVFAMLSSVDQLHLLKTMDYNSIRRYIRETRKDALDSLYTTGYDKFSPAMGKFRKDYHDQKIKVPVWFQGREYIQNKQTKEENKK